MSEINLVHLQRGTKPFDYWSRMIVERHYKHSMPSQKTSYELYVIWMEPWGPAGALVFGRPQTTYVKGWFGPMDKFLMGKCAVTNWQVLNLARVWIHPDFQTGGVFCHEGIVPGFIDRQGQFRSTLASETLCTAMKVIAQEYLVQRPPVNLSEPYEIEWLISYCDTSLHKGTIYRQAGFELFRTNEAGIQTWRIRLPRLTQEQDRQIRDAVKRNPRSQRFIAQRAQGRLF